MVDSKDIIIGSEWIYEIDAKGSLWGDGYIASGTESFVYKGIKKSKNGEIKISCVLKFKHKAMQIGDNIVNLFERFQKKDLKMFNELQECRSIARIYDVIEDLGDFYKENPHDVDKEGNKTIITRKYFFCVVEEFVDGWTLEEYCRDEFWKLTDEGEINGHKRKISFHEFDKERQENIIKSYHQDYDQVIRYQSEMLEFMIKLCDILDYTYKKGIIHLDLKPENIMITRYGKEVVLIDFGRAAYINQDGTVNSPLKTVNYSQDESEGMFEYGTLGYAAPECYAEAESVPKSTFPFGQEGFKKGEMSIESDVFSFGATFWECFSMFELYTKSQEFAVDKNDRNKHGSYDFYKNHFLNDEAYFDRDLSITSKHYHKLIEDIIIKCTHKRTQDYRKSDKFYHQYNSNDKSKYKALKEDIEIAKESAPGIIKTEDIKVRNAFTAVGFIGGLIIIVLFVWGFFGFAGNYFSNKKMDAIMNDYRDGKFESLCNATIEHMNASSESEKHITYNRIYDFFNQWGNGLEEEEITELIKFFSYMDDIDFIEDSIDHMLLDVDKVDDCAQKISVNERLLEIDSEKQKDGHKLAVHLANAKKHDHIYKCYQAVVEYETNTEFSVIIRKIASELYSNDDNITLIAQNEINESKDNESDLAEKKHEIKDFLIRMQR